jgi:hypothetical protein
VVPVWSQQKTCAIETESKNVAKKKATVMWGWRGILGNRTKIDTDGTVIQFFGHDV